MSTTHAISLKRSTSLLAAVAFMALLAAVNLSALFGTASAADLTSRSLTLSSSLPGDENTGDPGSETNGADAEHTFSYTAATAGVVTTTFTYCTTAIGDGGGIPVNGCTAPTGLVLPAAPAASAGTATASDNQITWTNSYGTGAQTVTFEGITNPTDVGSFFVRIQTEDSGGDPLDYGVVASAITEGIQITARVSETLGFSTTGDFSTGVGDPGTACNALTGSGAITLGDPNQENTLELNKAYDNYSAFRIYTNAASGVLVQYRGDTLRRSSGGEISAIGGTPALSIPGTEQFGLAIDTVNGGNDQVAVESRTATLDMTYVDDNAGLTNVATGPMTIAADYAGGSGAINGGSHTALFAFEVDTPTTIASTSGPNGFTECKTAAVRYIANISPTTTSGTYTTTVVYSAVPTY